MLTDEELATLVAHRYGDVAMTVPLNDVQQRGDRRRLRGRIASGALIAVVVLLIGGASVWFTSAHTTSTTSGRSLGDDCDQRYAAMIAVRSDRKYLPTRLAAPIIDTFNGSADFRVYVAVGTRVADPQGLPARVVFDCSHTAAGKLSAHLMRNDMDLDLVHHVATSPGDQAYLVYLPDGSSALVGWLLPGSTAVHITARGGEPITPTIAHGYFLAWSPTLDLAGATIRVDGTDLGDLVTLQAPSVLTDTFDSKAFLAVCHQLLNGSPGNSTFHGSQTPVLQDTHPSTNQAIAVYVGNVTASCVFGDIGDSQNVGMPVDLVTPAHTTTYAWGAFGGDGDGFLTGIVPTDTTSVRIVGADGTNYPAVTKKGVFVAWITEKLFTSPGTRLTVTSPTTTHTYTSQISAQ